MTPRDRSSDGLLWVTIGALVLYAAAVVALGTPPDAGDSGATVVSWLRDHDANVRLALWITTITFVPMGVWVALVRQRLPAVHRDVFLVGALVFLATTMAQSWFLAGLSWHADALQPATARTLLDVASFWGPVLTAATILMFGSIGLLALRGEAGLPRWLGYVVAVFVVEQAVETVTIFGKTGFIAPGGPMNLMLGAGLFGVAFVATGVALARSPVTAAPLS